MNFIDTLPKTEEEIELFCILQKIQILKNVPPSAYPSDNIRLADRIAELQAEYFKKLEQLQTETK